MKRSLSLVACLVAGLVLGAGLPSSPAEAKCKKNCRHALTVTLKACKKACTKGKPGKSCRAGCLTDFKAARQACKAATNPTPPDCGQLTTTTVPGSGATTTTLAGSPGGTVVKGALVATPGRFNFNATLGLPGANAACSTNFPGSHPCTIQELQGAPASDLTALRDTGGNPVNSFWAIDTSAPNLQQCNDDAPGGSGLNWEYATAHTASRGERVALTNGTGALGTVQTGVQCNIAGTSWVGCCQ